jgi:ribose/xylose/arabinose/galactoside ABC-type transport system permease subunit
MTQQPSSRFVDFLSRYGIFLILIILVLALSIITPIIRGDQLFLSSRNFFQILLQASINAIIAIAMTFIITSGGIDLSVGSIVALAGITAALAMKAGADPWLGFFVAVLAGVLCGLFNAFLINVVGLVPFIATLGTMGIFRGLGLIFSEGLPIYGFSREFLAIFAGRIGPVPVQVIVAVVIAFLGWFVLTQTRFGKYTTAIGGNEETAKLAGIPVKKYKFGIYALGGLLTGVASALLTARLSSADPTAATFYELDAIAATVMGGTSLSGGSGTILGTIVGALVISLVRNGMNLLNVPSFWQQFVIGSVIILAASLDVWRRKQIAKS